MGSTGLVSVVEHVAGLFAELGLALAGQSQGRSGGAEEDEQPGQRGHFICLSRGVRRRRRVLLCEPTWRTGEGVSASGRRDGAITAASA